MPKDIELDRLDDISRRMIEAMAPAQEHMLAEARGGNGNYMSAMTRRQALRGAAVFGGTAAATLLGGEGAQAQETAPAGAILYPVQKDPTKEQGRAAFADGGYGSRSQFEDETRWWFPTATRQSTGTMTPLGESRGIITPSGLHFERHHAGIPNIDPDTHELFVHGMLDKPTRFSIAELKRYPSISRQCFIECSGNSFAEWRQATMKTVQGTHGLMSNSEWTGVRLSTILNELGVKNGASWVLAEGRDAAQLARSIPIEKCWDDAILAYAQNGEALRPEQGYPLRLLLPGFEGNMSVKWLQRLEVSDNPFMTQQETSKYTDLLGNGKARQFTFIMEAKSVITFPSGEMVLHEPGFYEITGLAWSGRGRINRVEISTNGGKSWDPAVLQEPVLSKCHTRFRFPWRWDGKPAILQSRCQDETGYIQPTIKQLVDVRGLNSLYHMNGIQSWAVDSDGSVYNVHYY